MSKLLIFLSFLSLVILAVGTYFFPNYPLFLLASDSNTYRYIIEILASLLFFQLITRPPRHMIFRLLSGMIAALVGGWVIVTTYNGTMPFLDVFSLLASAAAIGINALEVNSETAKKNHPVKTTSPFIA